MKDADKRGESWQRQCDLFLATLEKDAAERDEFLAEACGTDEVLRAEIEALLAANEEPDALVDRPPILEAALADAATALEDDAAGVFSTGDVLADRFEIVRFLGRGGMGTAYEAHDRELDESVALKVLRPEIARSATAQTRFRREISLARKVTHPNVCRVFDLSQDGDRAFLTMELLEGETLAARLERDGRLSLEEARPIVEQIAQALDAAHAVGVIHRDLKSSNVMLVPSSGSTRAVVTDFGLATSPRDSGEDESRLTRTGELLGTPAYMAPEQLESGEITPATDVYGLGILIYEMVTGQLPFAGETPFSVASRRLQEEAPSPRLHVPDLDRRWERAILRCLERHPADRFQRPGEAVEALKSQRLASLPSDKRRRVRQAGVAVAAAAALVVAFVFLRGTLSEDADGSSDPVAKASTASDRRSSSALPFEERDAVLITAFENTTGDETFDGTLEAALGRELANSQFVTVVSKPRIQDTLTLMRLPPDTRVDADVGREIALRDGEIRALVSGRIERLGSAWVLSADLIDPSDGATVASLSEEALHMEEFLGGIRRLSSSMRELLGEEIGRIRKSEAKLEKVTTPSLKALRLYTEADRVVADVDNAVAEELLRQALVEDPDFASAHALLYYALRHQERLDEALPHAVRAMELADTAPERERYFIRSTYYFSQGDLERWRANLEALVRLHPDHRWANLNLRSILANQGRYEDSVPYTVNLARYRPRDAGANFEAGDALARLANGTEEAQRYFQRVVELVEEGVPGSAGFAAARLFPSHVHWLRGDPQSVRDELERLAGLRESLPPAEAASMAPGLANGYLSIGLVSRELAIRRQSGTNSRLYRGVAAFFDGDAPRVAEHLAGSWPDRPLWLRVIEDPARMRLLAQAGFLAEARHVLSEFETATLRPGPSAEVLWNLFRHGAHENVMKASLALTVGEPQKAIPLLEEALPRLRPGNNFSSVSYFAGSRALALAWLRMGEPEKALRVLEDASELKHRTFGSPKFSWMRLRITLIRLHRELGRDEDARRAEEELRNLLVLAEPDFWALRSLDSGRKAVDSWGMPPPSGSSD